jgi:Zn-finger nucleic acid-binding protein
MLCPVCKGVELVMSERQGIEIDYCPTCRGIWLDRGELDKLIERSAQPDVNPSAPYARQTTTLPAGRRDFEHSGQGHKDQRGHGQAYDQHGQRRSFWRDLFD